MLNRRRTSELLGLELDRSVQPGQPLSIVLGETDHFKAFIDGYGRERADHMLVALTRAISNRLREYGVIGRREGGELLVLLPGEGADEAFQVAETLRSIVTSTPVVVGHEDIRVTMTFGVAQSQTDDAPETWSPASRPRCIGAKSSAKTPSSGPRPGLRGA